MFLENHVSHLRDRALVHVLQLVEALSLSFELLDQPRERGVRHSHELGLFFWVSGIAHVHLASHHVAVGWDVLALGSEQPSLAIGFGHLMLLHEGGVVDLDLSREKPEVSLPLP